MEKTIIYRTDVKALEEDSLFRHFYLSMPDYRKKKIDGFAQRKDKMLSLGAGILLQKAAYEAGIAGADANVVVGEAGKPAFAQEPSFHFNLSHSGTKVLCAISPLPVGCDVELIRIHPQGVANRVFSSKELEELSLSQDKSLTFTRFWCRRESYLKMTGMGFLDNSRAEIATLPDLAFWEDKDSGYVYFCCLKTQGKKMEIEVVDVELSRL